jgi:propanol-preferring alcohol dehydrogenase
MTYRAARLTTPRPVDRRPLQLVDVIDDPLGPTEVRIRVDACAVCRTDLQLCEGDLVARRLPIVPGHQVVGTVIDTGGDVRGMQQGSVVGLAWIASSCGHCRFCTSGRENLCEHARFTGWDRDGGFAETVVADHRYVYPMVGDPSAIAPLLCGGAIGYRCLRAADVHAGQRIGLYGFGASASIVVQMTCHLGCEAFVITRSEAEQRRAKALGAVWTGGYDDAPPVPLDSAITFAPVGDVVVAALRAVDRGATVVVNAIHLDRIPQFDYDLLWWERSIRSVANVTRDDVRGLLELATQIPLRTEVSGYSLADANRALLDLRDGRLHGTAVLTSG